MELMHTDLYSVIKKGELTDTATRFKIAEHIAMGMHYLHSRANFVHRDLNPRNILVSDFNVNHMLTHSSPKTLMPRSQTLD